LTLPSKCGFGDNGNGNTNPVLANYLFCAIPRDSGQLKESLLPDDYLKREFISNDSLYAVDLRSGGIFPVIPTSQTTSFDAENMRVYENDLYFVDRGTRKLYRAPLAAVIDLQEEEAEQ
jgi:hypothetical protein